MREDKKDLLSEAYIKANNYVKAIQEIQQGESEARVCRKYNIKRSSFRHFIFHTDNEDIIITKDDKELILNNTYENIFIDIFGKECVIPIDIKETVEYVLERIDISDRNREVFLDRYISNKGFRELGKDYDISHERVRQIIYFVLKKMYNTHREVLYDGLTEYNNKIEDRKKNAKNNKKLAKFYGISITDLKLSNRAYNLLRANNIHTIETLTKYSRSDLLEIRSLGEGTADEIITKLDAYLTELNTSDSE